MNPVAQQLAKGGPFAPTSWGAFGPGWLWIESVGEAGQNIPVNPATEREIANPITPSKPQLVLVNTATEVELARTITPFKPILEPIGTAVERELAQMIIPQLGAPVFPHIDCAVLLPKATCAILSPSAECEIL